MEILKIILLVTLLFLEEATSNPDLEIKCHTVKDNIVVLKHGSTSNVGCSLQIGLNSTDLRANISKTSDNCPSEKSRSDVNVLVSSSTNKNATIEVIFANVTWGIGGDYALIVEADHAIAEKNFQVRISDAPAMPSLQNVTFTNYMYHGDHVFALEAMLPKPHKCSYPLKRQYRFSYRPSHGCPSKNGRADILCEVDADTDGVSKDLVCQDPQTRVCDMAQLKECKYGINVTGKNTIGSSHLLNILTPRLKYTVPALSIRIPRLKATGPKTLSASWLKPYCGQIEFSYNIYLIDLQTNISSKKLFIKTSSVTIRKSLSNLKPYNRYRFCVKALNRETDAFSKEVCVENRTLQDAPVKAPEIIDITQFPDTRQGSSKWKCQITWKVPDRQFWNGVPYLQVEYYENKAPEHVWKSKILNISTTTYSLKDLEKGRDYSVHISICTTKCTSSKVKNISHPGAKKPSIDLYIVIGVVLFMVFVIVLALVIIFYKRRRYGRLREDAAILENPMNEDAVVNPRPGEGHYDEIEEDVAPCHQYANAEDFHVQQLPAEEQVSENSVSEPSELAARLEFAASDELGALGQDETELVPVRT
eukprot:gene16960-18669_t